MSFESTGQSGGGQFLDLFFGKEDWWPVMIAEAQSNRDSQGLPVLPLAGQVWLKLQAGRTVDAGDLSRLFALASDEQIAEVGAFLAERSSPEDLRLRESGPPGPPGVRATPRLSREQQAWSCRGRHRGRDR